MPALCDSPSSRPNASTASATAAAQSPGRVMSPHHGPAGPLLTRENLGHLRVPVEAEHRVPVLQRQLPPPPGRSRSLLL